MDGKNNGSFWPSYVDIMTTLFAIMLVLFAVSFTRFKIKEKDLNDKNKELEDLNYKLELIKKDYESIISVYTTVNTIDQSKYYGYDDVYLKHMFRLNVEYQSKEFDINHKLKLDKENIEKANDLRREIVASGKLVLDKVKELNRQTHDNNIKFLVIIEGQSSKVAFNEGPWRNNYTLSYLRAQYLNEFWKQNGIDFASIDRCEIIISGSGEEGVPRDPIDIKNQRFLINIVPVIGNIENAKNLLNQIENKN